METWRIAVGSLRRPKLEAVREAASTIEALLGTNAATTAEQHGFQQVLLRTGRITTEVIGYVVDSGVSHTPASREELMLGARQRAEALQAKLRIAGTSADFYVGLEGGLDVVHEKGTQRVFLESWAYVSDGQRGHFGCSGSIELPQALADEVLTRGTELGVAIDEYAGAVGIRDGEGAWGILSHGLISRRESFRLAVIAAFAPFYNANMYPTASGSRTPTSAGPGSLMPSASAGRRP